MLVGLGVGIGVSTFAKTPIIIAKDSFNRADSTSLGNAETGQPWIVQASEVYEIKNNAVNLKTGGINYSQILVNTPKSDGVLFLDVKFYSNEKGGIVFRNRDNSNFLHYVITPTGLELTKYVANTATLLGNYGFTPAHGTVYKLVVVLNGDIITAYIDGVQKIQVAETYNKTETKHGIRNPLGFAISFDNFKMEEL
ncbi:hypothetical protein JNUCC23_02035 [Peribacillus sp. JNUCC 23]